MTIITKPLSGQKNEKDEVLIFVPTSAKGGNLKSLPTSSGDPADLLRARQSKQRRTSYLLTQACLMVSVMVALCVGFVGVVHIVRQMRRPHYFHGVSRLPYPASSSLSVDSMISGRFGNQDFEGQVHGLKPVLDEELTGEELKLNTHLRGDGTVELVYELDLEYEEFESFEFPEISHGRYIHDFKFNKTAIIDPDGERCFVMPLDRKEIPRPKTLFDVIRNMKNGVYDMDIEEIRHDTRVSFPALKDLSHYGLFITSACEGKTTFLLERVEIMKRSVGGEKNFQFVELAGKKLIKYNIINFADV